MRLYTRVSSPTMSTSNYLDVNGYRMHYREWGDPSSPDLVLVHGWSTTSVVWHDVAEALSDGYHIVAPDMRGNGESTIPKDGFLVADFASDVHELIAALDLKQPFYAGNSWGANVGTYVAAEYPDDIGKAVLEDPVYWKMVEAFATVVPGVIERRALPDDAIRAEALGRGLTDEQADRELYLAKHFTPEVLERVSGQNRSWALECDGYLARIAVPTLVLVADSDAGGYITPEELDHHRASASDMVEFQRWEGVGHMMHTAQPERFVRQLREFFGRVF